MDRHIIIFATDKRQEALEQLLSGQKVRCSWDAYRREDICEKIYVLPTPVSKLDKNTVLKEKLKQELINCKGPVMVFAGAVNMEWKNFLEENGIAYWDFMQMQEVVEGNARITAEATIAEVLLRSFRSICEQTILVTGYGCCGSRIAKVFHALGAEVIVAARREAVRIQVEEDGYQSIDFSEINNVSNRVDTVINTVPAVVITEEIIENMRKDSLIVDIASSPGGTDFEAAKRHEIPAYPALGLPGIYTTMSSAELLKNAISKHAPLQKDVKEDRQWIFQIII